MFHKICFCSLAGLAMLAMSVRADNTDHSRKKAVLTVSKPVTPAKVKRLDVHLKYPLRLPVPPPPAVSK